MKRASKTLALTLALLLAVILGGKQSYAAPAVSVQSLQEQIQTLQNQIQDLADQLKAVQDQQTKTPEAIAYAVESGTSKLATGEKVKISGYVQSQYTNDQPATPQDNFMVRRARLKLTANISEMASAVLEVGADKSVTYNDTKGKSQELKLAELKEAYIDLGRANDNWRFRLGQSKVPFMYDILQSSSVRLTPESTALSAALFPGEYDTGAWLQLKNVLGDSIPDTQLEIGAMNGTGPGKNDVNNNKDLVARLRFNLGNAPVDSDYEANSAYLGYQTGQILDSGVTTDKRFLGGGASYITGPFWFRGEAVGGELKGKDVGGWYGQAAYFIPNTLDTAFVRYENYDEDQDISNNNYKSTTVGYEHKLDAKTRITLAHEFRNPDKGYSKFSTTDDGLTTLRLQVKF
jgi:hypothetical protein